MLKAREREEAAKKPLASVNVLDFCEKELDFKPTAYQEKLQVDRNQFVVARQARQSGKSLTMAALTLHYALTHPKSRVAFTAPSLRQSRRKIRKISTFLSKLGSVLEGKAVEDEAGVPQRAAGPEA